MTNRLVIGQRGAQSGMWLSRAGVDVLTATEPDLLLSPDYDNLQFFFRGVVTINPSTFADVLFGTTLTFKPLVLFMPMYSGAALVPPVQFFAATLGGQERVSVASFNDRVRFQNVTASAVAITVRYLFLRRGI